MSALKAAFANKQLPDLENGNTVFMMSKSAYLTDEGDHNGPHLMFFTALKDGKNWGAGASGSPVVSGPYWFLQSKEPSQAKGLRRFLCSQSKLQSGPTERPHPCIKSRLTTTQSRHPTELRHGNPSGLPSELSANRKLSRNGHMGNVWGRSTSGATIGLWRLYSSGIGFRKEQRQFRFGIVCSG